MLIWIRAHIALFDPLALRNYVPAGGHATVSHAGLYAPLVGMAALHANFGATLANAADEHEIANCSELISLLDRLPTEIAFAKAQFSAHCDLPMPTGIPDTPFRSRFVVYVATGRLLQMLCAWRCCFQSAAPGRRVRR